MNEQMPSENSGNKSIKEAWPQIIIFLAVVFFIVFGASFLTKSLTTNKEEVKEIVNEVIKEKRVVISKPSCQNTLDEYLMLKSKGNSLQMVNGLSAYATNEQFVGDVEKIVGITGQGEIACGYLYIRASANKKSLSDIYDSVYINPQDFGGHILRNKGIMSVSTDNYTEALIPLDSVSYLPSKPYNPEAKNFGIADWSKLLNVNSHLKFNIGFSTENRGGLIEDISIAYKCWNPTTGEETDNCLLSLVD